VEARVGERRKGTSTKTGYPKFKKHSRSVEYKHSGWKLNPHTKKHITFTDKIGIGRLKLIGSRDIYFFQPERIKRVRLLRRADGYQPEAEGNRERAKGKRTSLKGINRAALLSPAIDVNLASCLLPLASCLLLLSVFNIYQC